MSVSWMAVQMVDSKAGAKEHWSGELTEYLLGPWWVERMVKEMELTLDSKTVYLMVVLMEYQKEHSRD